MKAYMFPGQGSQYRGMGKNLFKSYTNEVAKASSILGYDLEELCLLDPAKQLGKTEFTQPALYVVNALTYYDQQNGKAPDFLIGHSLGEYNALLAAGAFDFETGLRLVQKRGALMAAASGGGMAAVIGLDEATLRQKLNENNFAGIDIANFNTPSQLVIAGQAADINAAVTLFDKQGIRIIPLAVSAPFHSRYMQPAANEFATFLNNYSFQALKIPVVSNYTGTLYAAEKIPFLLSKQISSSVLWTDSIRFLMGQEVSEYAEIGGAMLTKMVTEIRNNCTPIKENTAPKNIPVQSESAINHSIQSAPKINPPIPSAPEVHPHIPGAPPPPPSTLHEAPSNPHESPSTPQPLTLANRLGSQSFRQEYNLQYAYLAGAMYKGIASKEMVINMAPKGLLCFLGTGGMPLSQVEQDIRFIQSALKNKEPYGMNFLHHINNPLLEKQTIDLFLKYGITNIEAAAFMQMTEALIYYRVSGLRKDASGNTICTHRIIAKVSRPEVAELFMRPAPEKIIQKLYGEGLITAEQASLAQTVPVSYDICVEADSGGHTDGGVALVLLPAIQQLRTVIQQEMNYPGQLRVGLAGGLGTPQAIASAFIMEADFVLTGSVNQCTVEAGTSDIVKDLLQEINVQDTSYAPAGDMFEIGARVQVLKRGVLFPARANKLYGLYNQYESLQSIPEKLIVQLEKNYFKRSIDQIWEETKQHKFNKGEHAEIDRAESNPKHKMALIFRWYFGFSNKMALEGNETEKVNFQIHTGPALGAFNQWVKGTSLASWRNRHAGDIGVMLMEHAAGLLQKTLTTITNNN